MRDMDGSGTRDFIAAAREIVEAELQGNRCCVKYQKEIRKAQNQFLQWLNARGLAALEEVRKKDILDFQVFLTEQKSQATGNPLTPGTLLIRFGAVKMLFSVLYRAGLLKDNITHAIPFELPFHKGKRRAFSRKEIFGVLEYIDTQTQLRDRAMFELMYSSGLRVSEASGLLVKDISLQRREMIVRGKFDRDRVVPVSQVAAVFLRRYLGQRIHNSDEPVFLGLYGSHAKKGLKPESISSNFRRILKKLNMDRKETTTHSIRHSTATHLLDNGAGIRQVQELLGHRNLETTVRYTHVQTEGLFKIYRKYHPREHDLFEVTGQAYSERIRKLLVDKGGVRRKNSNKGV